MSNPSRGEVWRARLNQHPQDPSRVRRIHSDQMSHQEGYTVVLSRASIHTRSDFATVVPRSSSAKSIWGGVESPVGDGGCGRAAIVDAWQPYTLKTALSTSDGAESQLLEAVARGRTIDARTLRLVEGSLGEYFETSVTRVITARLGRQAPRRTRPHLSWGDVVVAQWEGHGPVECVVVSNSIANTRRRLSLVTVIPTAPAAQADCVASPVVLDSPEDGVSERRVAITESPYTIDVHVHVAARIGRVRSHLKMQQICEQLMLYLDSLPSNSPHEVR